MRLRRFIVSALLVITLIGGLQIMPAAAASSPSSSYGALLRGMIPNSSGNLTSQQGGSLSSVADQIGQQGVDFSSFMNLLRQFSTGSTQSSTNESRFYNLLKLLFGNRGLPTTGNTGGLTNTLLAKAKPDACFAVLAGTDADPTLVRDTPIPASGVCPRGTQPKTDQEYVWGLTQSGNDLWFGTAANVQCQVAGTYLDLEVPSVSKDAACEYGVAGNPYRDLGPLGDWRPPLIYFYNLTTNSLTDASAAPGNSGLAADLNYSLGIRSAGAVGNYVLMAGPGLPGYGPNNNGVNVYVFTASTHAYQGMIHLAQYDNIRKWITYDNVLYTAMHKTAAFGTGGDVLKWNPGNLNPLTAFTPVGHVNGDPAELAVFNNQLYVNTWPDPTVLTGLLNQLNTTGSVNLTNLPAAVAGLWMSPVFNNGSLGPSTANWTEVWNVLQYEPDPVTALTYGGGAMSVYNGALYWGTMHVPAFSTLVHLEVYGPAIVPTNVLNGDVQAFENSERATSIFRGSNFGTPNQNVQLLYGESSLPVWVPDNLANFRGPGHWVTEPTRAGQPLYGHSGFGNPFNTYDWSMAVYKGQLYVGTLDWSMLSGQAGNAIGLYGGFSPAIYGADLWKFPSANSPAVAVNTTGVGNPYNYGIRNMITAQDGSALYLGMADPMNLAQVNGKPIGGWELRQLK